MILAQAQQAAEVGMTVSPMAMYITGGIGALILVDRVIHILQSRGLLVNGKKKRNSDGNPHGNPHGFITPDQWNEMSDQMQALYHWHLPDRPNQPGQKIWWMPWAEFERLMKRSEALTERSIKANEKNTHVVGMLVTTLEEIQRAGRLRDLEIKKHGEMLEQLLSA